jgi:hypothetical protein
MRVPVAKQTRVMLLKVPAALVTVPIWKVRSGVVGLKPKSLKMKLPSLVSTVSVVPL